MDTLIQKIYFQIIKINNFRGELTDNSAKKEALAAEGPTYRIRRCMDQALKSGRHGPESINVDGAHDSLTRTLPTAGSASLQIITNSMPTTSSLMEDFDVFGMFRDHAIELLMTKPTTPRNLAQDVGESNRNAARVHLPQGHSSMPAKRNPRRRHRQSIMALMSDSSLDLVFEAAPQEALAPDLHPGVNVYSKKGRSETQHAHRNDDSSDAFATVTSSQPSTFDISSMYMDCSEFLSTGTTATASTTGTLTTASTTETIATASTTVLEVARAWSVVRSHALQAGRPVLAEAVAILERRLVSGATTLKRNFKTNEGRSSDATRGSGKNAIKAGDTTIERSSEIAAHNVQQAIRCSSSTLMQV